MKKTMPAGRQEKLRVILLVYDNFYCNPIFLPLLESDFIDIVLVVVSDVIFYRKNKIESLLFFYRKHGLRYFLFKTIDQIIYVISKILNIFLGRKRLFLREARKRRLRIIKMKDVNSEESLGIFGSYSPDIIISYFNQVLKRRVLDIPRITCLNVHPGYLPLYKGVASSFWAMLKGEKFGGVTVHDMVEKLDSGDIYARGKVVTSKKMSLHRHNWECCKLGGKLLLETLNNLWEGKIKKDKNIGGNYYSWPGAKDVDQFHSLGFKLIKREDLEIY